MSEVNWDEITQGGYIKIEEGTPKTMWLQDWAPQTQFKDKDGLVRPGVVFKVIKEDETDYTEPIEWTVTSKRALSFLAPICQKAEAANQQIIKVSVVAIGEGVERKYSIKEIA